MKTKDLRDAWQIVLTDEINVLIAKARGAKGNDRQQLLSEACQDSLLIDRLTIGWSDVRPVNAKNDV